MRIGTYRLLGFVLTLMLCVGLVAGCAGSATPTATPAAPAATAAPAAPAATAAPAAPAATAAPAAPAASGDGPQGVKDKVITIGIGSVMSGPQAAASQNSDALIVYLNMVNRKGGVNGYTFKYTQRDYANQPAQAVAIAKQFKDEDKVFGMTIESTNGTQAIVPIAGELKFPILANCDGDIIRTVPNMFGFTPRYTCLPLAEAQFLIKHLGIKDIAYFYSDDAAGRPGLKVLPDFVKSIGGNLVAMVPYNLDSTDFAPMITKLRDSESKGVIYFGGVGQLASALKAADAIGYKPTWLSVFGNLSPSFLKTAGALAEGMYIDSHVLDVNGDSPQAKELVAEMTAAGKEKSISGFAGTGWTMGAVWEEGVKRATANGEPLTWDSFNKALETINGEPIGMIESLRYVPGDHSGPFKDSVYQVKDGKFVLVQPLMDIPQPVSN